MACFLVPTAEAIVTTVITKVAENKSEKSAEVKVYSGDSVEPAAPSKPKNSFVRKLKWLNYMLWGGAALLAFEHLWHGEVTPWFPFLTAASNASDAAVMLHEMSTIGVAMAVLVTAVWAGMVLVTNAIEKRAPEAETEMK